MWNVWKWFRCLVTEVSQDLSNCQVLYCFCSVFHLNSVPLVLLYMYCSSSIANFVSNSTPVWYELPLIVTLYKLTFFLESNLVAGELCGSLHCCHTHQVVQFRLAVQEVRESQRVLAYRHLPWSLGFPAWTHLEALQTHRRQSVRLSWPQVSAGVQIHDSLHNLLYSSDTWKCDS